MLSVRDRPTLPAAIVSGRVIAVARGLDPDRLDAIVDALVDGGITAVEITLSSPSALQAIAALCRRADGSSLTIGGGTVLDVAGAEAATAAGAAFLVAPHLDVATVRWAAERGIPMLPGAMTPTEVVAAWSAGAAAVKVFPASVVGPAFVRELRGPLPEIPLVPTGGVTAATARSFLDAGAIVVGVGSWLTGGVDSETIRARARELRRTADAA